MSKRITASVLRAELIILKISLQMLGNLSVTDIFVY